MPKTASVTFTVNISEDMLAEIIRDNKCPLEVGDILIREAKNTVADSKWNDCKIEYTYSNPKQVDFLSDYNMVDEVY